MKFYIKISLLSATLLVGSCALKPIQSQYEFVKFEGEKPQMQNLGNGKVLICNTSNALYRMDNSAKINVWLNEKPMGQIDAREYVVIALQNGINNFTLLHNDGPDFKSKHQVYVDETTKVIEIRATAASNELEVTNQMPKNYELYKYAKVK